MKSGLAVGEGDLSVGQFTKEELRDLFTFQPNISCDTHNLLQCNCDGVGKVIKVEGEEEQVEERKCQLGRSTSTSGRGGTGKKQAEIAGWQHFKEPVESFVTDGLDHIFTKLTCLIRLVWFSMAANLPLSLLISKSEAHHSCFTQGCIFFVIPIYSYR